MFTNKYLRTVNNSNHQEDCRQADMSVDVGQLVTCLGGVAEVTGVGFGVAVLE